MTTRLGWLAAAVVLAATEAAAQGFPWPMLDDIEEGQRLNYHFVGQALDGRPLDDSIVLEIGSVEPDGRVNVGFEFLTGPDRFDVPYAMGVRDNPLLVMFLEREIQIMTRVTDMRETGLRSLLDNGLRRSRVTETRIIVDGQELRAREVTMLPFRLDQRLRGQTYFTERRYRFIFAADLPGEIYLIETEGEMAPGAPERQASTLTFTGVSG